MSTDLKSHTLTNETHLKHLEEEDPFFF